MTETKQTILLPEGTYDAIILEGRWEETLKSKNANLKNAYKLQMKFAILDPLYFDQKVYGTFNFINPNQVAVDIAKKEWEKFLLAIKIAPFEFDLNMGFDDNYKPLMYYKYLRLTVSHWQEQATGITRVNVKSYSPSEQTMTSAASKPTVQAGTSTQETTKESPPSWTTEPTPYDDLNDSIPF